ncbi:hypothetical protein L914_08638, partial [Phytophthora nicotianae]
PTGASPQTQGKYSDESVCCTLGWESVSAFEVWIINHSAGIDAVFGTNFTIPEGVHQDLFSVPAKLPDEVMKLHIIM